jgi:hypothetical protein
MKTGYKATYNFTCRGCIFEIGKSYELMSKPKMCEHGFHYCVNPKDVLNYYPIKHDFRLLEIEDVGTSITHEDKSVTNKLRVIREIPKEEYYQLFGIVNNESTITLKSGFWFKNKYDERNNKIYYESEDGYWIKREYDENNNEIYNISSNGYWLKSLYNENNICLKRESNYI